MRRSPSRRRYNVVVREASGKHEDELEGHEDGEGRRHPEFVSNLLGSPRMKAHDLQYQPAEEVAADKRNHNEVENPTDEFND
jgi:hypothetical protein